MLSIGDCAGVLVCWCAGVLVIVINGSLEALVQSGVNSFRQILVSLTKVIYRRVSSCAYVSTGVHIPYYKLTDINAQHNNLTVRQFAITQWLGVHFFK